MKRSTNLSLSIAMAISILSASSLSGDQAGDAFSFLDSYKLSMAAQDRTAATDEPSSTWMEHADEGYVYTTKVSYLVRESDETLSARQDAFIAQIATKLQSEVFGKTHTTAADIDMARDLNAPVTGSVSWNFGTHLQNGFNYAHRQAISPTTKFVTDSVSTLKQGYFAATQTVNDKFDATYDRISDVAVDIATFPLTTTKTFVKSLNSGEAGTFLGLVRETGFVFSQLNVGFTVLPVLSVYFEHERLLSEEERALASKRIEDYISDDANSVGYAEAVALRSLLKASSSDLDLKGVRVSVFPFPGFTLTFDPTRNQFRKEALDENS